MEVLVSLHKIQKGADFWLGICAGKSSVAQYLVDQEGFTRLYIREESHGALLHERNMKVPVMSPDRYTFQDAASLTDFVTRNWQQRWVTIDVQSQKTVEELLKRPSFLLVGVDAPVNVRWARLKAM